ncbi:hypothetical protein IWX91DRAFT_196477 [Phyllosticta citricarpa]
MCRASSTPFDSRPGARPPSILAISSITTRTTEAQRPRDAKRTLPTPPRGRSDGQAGRQAGTCSLPPPSPCFAASPVRPARCVSTLGMARLLPLLPSVVEPSQHRLKQKQKPWKQSTQPRMNQNYAHSVGEAMHTGAAARLASWLCSVDE